eukprot:m.191565 g.191565  ORF g.191565 m.191565 type:complete len:73 (+) comp18387_c0_seq1:2136-2354(+)
MVLQCHPHPRFLSHSFAFAPSNFDRSKAVCSWGRCDEQTVGSGQTGTPCALVGDQHAVWWLNVAAVDALVGG